ncbi:RHTO0S01e07492g1_1 [Rhodotorula toruloides]|uniref:RHTO0S01e07492g1_1 n=1 Tax=Rhodotorula toruloides TaxID=5286 RepID=A0A061AE42_RHOTO|nr:RHTO0S01e07492g1_1 [Rhodotorula toruloides]
MTQSASYKSWYNVNPCSEPMQDLPSGAQVAAAPRLDRQQEATKHFDASTDRSDNTLEITIEISLRKGDKAFVKQGTVAVRGLVSSFPYGSANPALLRSITVNFTVNPSMLNRSQSRLFVAGNIPQLGNWGYKSNFELQRSTQDGKREYTGTLKLHSSLAGKVEYKLIATEEDGNLGKFERAGGAKPCLDWRGAR